MGVNIVEDMGYKHGAGSDTTRRAGKVKLSGS
jgi:hypothetical protein